MPFYKDKGIKLQAVLTDNGSKFCGKENHPYELFLVLNDIEHRRTRVRSPKINGFAIHFNRTVLNEFFQVIFREKFFETVGSFQNKLDVWLNHYNTKCLHQGYTNNGKHPIDTTNLYLDTVRQVA